MSKRNRLFFTNRWAVAYRLQNKTDDISFDKETPFHFVSVPKHHWIADPFLISYNDKVLLFCEYTNEKKSKSYIAYKEIFPNEQNEWMTAFEFSGHSSYPCVFKYMEHLYMIPETTFDRNVVLLVFDETSQKWIKHSTLLNSINAPDSTFCIYDGKPSLFLYEILSEKQRRLYFCQLSEDLSSIVSKRIVKEYDCPDGRPGGKCLFLKNKHYRIVQPGINQYGEKLVFYEFGFDSSDRYYETIKEIIEPKDIPIICKNDILGVHTYNTWNNLEVVDLLVKSKFELFRPVKVFFKRLNIFGYGLYDQKKKFVNPDFNPLSKKKK